VADLSSIIKAYDVRGVVPDQWDEDVARRIGAAFAEFVVADSGATTVVTAHDMRDSSIPLSRAFAALADPIRRDIVARLTADDATVTELAAPYDVSLQAVSKHLGVLEAAGLISRRRDGQQRWAHLEVDVFDLLTGWIDQHRRRAELRYQRLDAVLADLPETRTDTQE